MSVSLRRLPGRAFLGSVLAISRKELQGYFSSPLSWLVAAVFWLLAGYFFNQLLFSLLQQALMADQQAQMSGMPPGTYDMASELIQGFVSLLGLLSLFILPLLSMGLYAEERRRGTLELLATSPVTSFAVALGKWLGALVFYLALVLPLLVYEGMALNGADPPVNPVLLLVAHLGLGLMASAVLSLGLFLSAITDSTLLAAVFTFGVMLLLWTMELLASRLGGGLGDVVRSLSLLTPFNDLAAGIITTNGLVWFASLTVLGWFLTVQAVNAFRLQRS